MLKEAFFLARTGRPGPVLVDIVTEIFDTPLDFTYPESVQLLGYDSRRPARTQDLARAAAALSAARRPVIMAGGGVILADTAGTLTQLALDTGIPVVTTLMGKGAVPDSLPQHLGMLGMHGSYAANLAVTGCDLLLAFGVRFDERSTAKATEFAPAAQIVHFNVDPSEINKIIPAQISVPASLQDALPRFQEALREISGLKERFAPWREHCLALKQEVPFAAHTCKDGVSPELLLKETARRAPEDTIVATDVGQHQMWAAQFFPTDRPRHFLTSGGLGTMGFGLPAALGAKAGCPDSTVLLITGDGSILMNCQEFTTLPTYGLAVKTLVLKNGQLGLVRQLQHVYRGGRYSQTQLVKKPHSGHCGRHGHSFPGSCFPGRAGGGAGLPFLTRRAPPPCWRSPYPLMNWFIPWFPAGPRPGPYAFRRRIIMQWQHLALLVNNKPGVLAHVAGLLAPAEHQYRMPECGLHGPGGNQPNQPDGGSGHPICPGPGHQPAFPAD